MAGGESRAMWGVRGSRGCVRRRSWSVALWCCAAPARCTFARRAAGSFEEGNWCEGRLTDRVSLRLLGHNCGMKGAVQ